MRALAGLQPACAVGEWTVKTHAFLRDRMVTERVDPLVSCRHQEAFRPLVYPLLSDTSSRYEP